jgi:hypothetical protein
MSSMPASMEPRDSAVRSVASLVREVDGVAAVRFDGRAAREGCSMGTATTFVSW